MTRITCKKCRRAGESLCGRDKCAFKRRPFAPGKLDSEKKHRSQTSEYGQQMREKQKIKQVYGVSEKQFVSYVNNAQKATLSVKIPPVLGIYTSLESRLDNVVFRMGLAKSRALARQIVAHGHILVNGKRISIASHKVKIGDVISIREGSKSLKLFTDMEARLKDFSFVNWIAMDSKKLEAKIVSMPKEVESWFDFTKVLEFYNK